MAAGLGRAERMGPSVPATLPRPAAALGQSPQRVAQSASVRPGQERLGRQVRPLPDRDRRIRRGLVTTRKGNDGRLLVPVSTDARVTVHEQVTDTIADRSEAAELRAEVVELRVALARAEERRAAGERRE